MRRLAPLLLIPALLLTACGSSEEKPSGSSSSSSAAAEELPEVNKGVKVEGEYGTAPELTFDGDPADELQRTTLSEGDGEVVESGDLLVVDYLGQVWGGDEPFDESFSGAGPTGFPIGTGAVIPGWDRSLVGLTEGSRVLLSIPPADGYGEQGSPDAGIAGTDTLVFVIDIVDTFSSDAAGDPDAAVKENDTPIEVGGELGKRPSVTVPEGTPVPTEQSTTVLAEGDGPAVTDGSIVVQYEAVDWASQPVESSWELGSPVAGEVATGGTGPFDALIGLPIGSRVLVQLPTGEADPASAAYALVVDIVAQPTHAEPQD